MINIGLVGLGFIGKTHMEAYQTLPNANVLQLCTRSGGKKDFPSYKGEITADYEVLLQNPAIDVIDICVPTYLHETYITKAAESGKHIICEKPLALNQEAAKRIRKAVEAAGIRLFVGHILRFWPAYQEIKNWGKQENVQAIDIVHAKRLGQVPAWSEWFKYPEKSGGALFDLHIHDIDFTCYLLGEVKSVYAVGLQNEYGAWNHLLTTLCFENGEKAFIEASHTMPAAYPFTMSFRAQANERAIDFQLTAGENIEQINEMKLVLYDGKDQKIADVNGADAFRNELGYFLNCLERNQENQIIPLDDVLYNIQVLEAIEQSLETGRVQFLNETVV